VVDNVVFRLSIS